MKGELERILVVSASGATEIQYFAWNCI